MYKFKLSNHKIEELTPYIDDLRNYGYSLNKDGYLEVGGIEEYIEIKHNFHSIVISLECLCESALKSDKLISKSESFSLINIHKEDHGIYRVSTLSSKDSYIFDPSIDRDKRDVLYFGCAGVCNPYSIFVDHVGKEWSDLYFFYYKTKKDFSVLVFPIYWMKDVFSGTVNFGVVI